MTTDNMIHQSNCFPETQAAGDIVFCGDAFLRTRDGGDPFVLISEQIGSATACVNCETSLEGGKKTEKNVALSVDEKSLQWIPANFEVVSIVNNHMADGSDPKDLACALRQRGKTVVGPGNPACAAVELHGIKFEFFSAYFSLPRCRLSYDGSRADALRKMIRGSDAQRCVVNLHWGYEHTHVPAPFQRALARRLVDAGADLIIGHHPHVPQGWETYGGASVFYSLGNFNFWQFDNEPSEDNKWGYMVRYDPQSGRCEPVPYRINDNYQPYVVAGREKEELLQQLEALCDGVKRIDNATWYSQHYCDWYAREFKVWIKRCRKKKSPSLTMKFLAWLLLPMQIVYYIRAAMSRISLLFERKHA